MKSPVTTMAKGPEVPILRAMACPPKMVRRRKPFTYLRTTTTQKIPLARNDGRSFTSLLPKYFGAFHY